MLSRRLLFDYLIIAYIGSAAILSAQGKRLVVGTEISSKDAAVGSVMTGDDIRGILRSELTSFNKNSKTKVTLTTTEAWELLQREVGSTIGPSDRKEAQQFVKAGFAAFLSDYAKFWTTGPYHLKEVPIDLEHLTVYNRERRDACGESPCRVPPCCRNGAKCSACVTGKELPILTLPDRGIKPRR